MLFLINKYKSTVIIVINIISIRENLLIVRGVIVEAKPIINKIWKEDRKSETITLVAPGINKDNTQYYKSAFDIDTITQVRMNGIRQKYIDMGISFNLYVDSRTATAARLRDILVEAWKCGLKTTYYLRSKSPTNEDIEEVVIKKEHNGIKCVGCEN